MSLSIRKSVESYHTKAALDRGLCFRPSKPLALISGAGIGGLAAAFELRAKGYIVVIAEKRAEFSRSNVINLKVEAQVFLKRFNLLEKFEKHVASRIEEHRYVVIDKSNTFKRLDLADVRDVHLDSVSFEPKNFHKLFKDDAIYSVSIKTFQTFLAENALEAGVNLLGEVTVDILSRTKEGGVSEVQMGNRTLHPDLLFIAEGARSTTASKLGMKTKSVVNACTGEHWIFGNLKYGGKETFVVSLMDASNKTLRIANVIFNAKEQVINVAVTSGRALSKKAIEKEILRTAHQVFNQTVFPLEPMDSELLTTVHKPVSVTNQTLFPFSRGNVHAIGDTAASSSPLAGLGGTLGVTLVPRTVRQLLEDREKHFREIHENFHRFSKGYTSTWFEKSATIKNLCIKLFTEERYG